MPLPNTPDDITSIKSYIIILSDKYLSYANKIYFNFYNITKKLRWPR